MQRHLRSRKRIAGILALTVVLVGGASMAFAYWTTAGGTGSGTASTGTAGAVTVTITNDVAADLAPAALADVNAVIDSVAFSVTNTANQNNHVNQVKISIPASFSVTTGGHPACTASDFSINGQPVANSVTGAASPVTQSVNVTLAPVAAGAPTNRYLGSFTLQLVENGANQDSCQGLTTVPLTVVAS